MLFDYESGIPELFKRQGGYLPGQIAKTGWERIEPVNSTSPSDAIEFGQVVKRTHESTPYVSEIEEDDTAPRFFGIAVCDVTSEAVANLKLDNPRYIKQYFSGSAISVMTEGWICVPIQNGNPVVGDPVYVRVTPSNTNSDLPIGGIETAGVGCVKWKGARFESVGFYPFNSTKNGTSVTGVTGKCAIISLEEERYGLMATVISAPNDVTFTYGTLPKDVTLTGGSVKYEGETVTGTFKLNNPTTIYDVGEYDTTCTFYPDNELYEEITNIEIGITVTKANLTLDQAPTASSVTIGNTLSTSILSNGVVKFGTTQIAGTWAWVDGTTVVNATGDFSAKFTPTTGAGNFNDLTTNVNVVALSGNKNITSVTVLDVSATEIAETGDWTVELPASTTDIIAESDIEVVLEDSNATYTINPESHTGLTPGDSKLFTIRVVAQDLSYHNYGLTTTIAEE